MTDYLDTPKKPDNILLKDAPMDSSLSVSPWRIVVTGVYRTHLYSQDEFDMKGLAIQAMTCAAKIARHIRGGVTIGPNSTWTPLDDTECEAIAEPFNDSRWDHSADEEPDSNLDDSADMILLTVQSVAHNMYMGEMERLRREIVKQDMRKREEARLRNAQAYREKITREVEAEYAEKSKIMMKAYDQRIRDGLAELQAKEVLFAEEDRKRLEDLARQKETRNNVLSRRQAEKAEKAKLNSYLDAIQLAQKQIRQVFTSYEEELAGLSASHRAQLKSSYDGRFRAALPPPSEVKISQAEVNKWQESQRALEELLSSLQDQIRSAHDATEAAKSPVQAPAPPQQAAQPQQPPPPPAQQPSSSQPPPPAMDPNESGSDEPDLTSYISATAQVLYNEVEQFGHQYLESIRPLTSDGAQKQFLLHGRMAAVTLLSKITLPTLSQNLDNLSSLLIGNPVQVNNKLVFASSGHPLGTRYCTRLLADKIVEESYAGKSTMPEYAKIIVWLSHRFPDFGLLVRFFFYKKFPTMVPYFIPKCRGQSSEEYRALRGYKGEDEDPELFLGRVATMTQLYATVIITPARQGETHVLGLKAGWQWIVDVLNMEPEPSVTAMVVTNFLEIAGKHLERAYGRQFKRLMVALKGPYIAKLRRNKQDVSYVGQLEVLIEKMRW